MARRLGSIWRLIALPVRFLSSNLGPARIIALTQGIDINIGVILAIRLPCSLMHEEQFSLLVDEYQSENDRVFGRLICAFC